jgi:hypothetical protein
MCVSMCRGVGVGVSFYPGKKNQKVRFFFFKFSARLSEAEQNGKYRL